MSLAVVIVLLVIGSLIFHFASPWYFTPIASNWTTIDFTVDVTFWVCGIVFVLVNLFTAYCLVKYRHRKNHRAHYEPESKKLEIWLTVVTGVGVAAMPSNRRPPCPCAVRNQRRTEQVRARHGAPDGARCTGAAPIVAVRGGSPCT